MTDCEYCAPESCQMMSNGCWHDIACEYFCEFFVNLRPRRSSYLGEVAWLAHETRMIQHQPLQHPLTCVLSGDVSHHAHVTCCICVAAFYDLLWDHTNTIKIPKKARSNLAKQQFHHRTFIFGRDMDPRQLSANCWILLTCDCFCVTFLLSRLQDGHCGWWILLPRRWVENRPPVVMAIRSQTIVAQPALQVPVLPADSQMQWEHRKQSLSNSKI